MYHHSSYQAGVANHNWQDGDIAFLRSHETFFTKDHRELIASGYLHRGATKHPVIILQAGPGRAIVTTVTAFNSGAENNFLPPWRMFAHKDKHRDDFHAFIGTQLPPHSNHAHLRLCNQGDKMYKPQASWVYIKHFFTVPYTVLVPWNRVPQKLRVSKESLIQLRADIHLKYPVQLRDATSRLTTHSRAAKPIHNQSTTQTRHIHRSTQIQRPSPIPHQQHEMPKPVEPTTKSSFLGPHDSNPGNGMANQRTTKPCWSQVAALSVAPVLPEAIRPRSQPAAVCQKTRLILTNS